MPSRCELTKERANVRLQLWDTAGSEQFSSFTKLYFKDAYAIVLVYDVTDRQSFEKIK